MTTGCRRAWPVHSGLLMKSTPARSSHRDAIETSVTFSLDELSRLEQDRVREEEVHRTRLREESRRQQRTADERHRAEEEARIAADAADRARRLREEAEEKARCEARARAALEVARIEAEAKARLEADNALRAHELAVLRARRERAGRNLHRVLGVALVLAVLGGSVTAYAMTRHVAALEQETERLRERQIALVREREQAIAGELAALDRRFATLRAGTGADAADEVLVAEGARAGIEVPAADSGRLRAFADALDALALRLQMTERRDQLDRRHADLVAWAAKLRRSEILAPIQNLAVRARTAGANESVLRAYEEALDRARAALVSGPARAQGASGVVGVPAPRCTNPHDPLCGLDGQPLLR